MDETGYATAPAGTEVGFSLVRISPCLSLTRDPGAPQIVPRVSNGPGARLLEFINGGSKPAADVEEKMQVLYPHCAGLDVHKDSLTACVRHMVDGTVKREVRTFDTTTKGLLALADWLASERCTHVAMEATGVYWKPV